MTQDQLTAMVYRKLPLRYRLSGVARTSRMLGHSMGTQRLYELVREVQKYLGGLGEARPENFLNFTASQVGSQAICIRETRVR